MYKKELQKKAKIGFEWVKKVFYRYFRQRNERIIYKINEGQKLMKDKNYE